MTNASPGPLIRARCADDWRTIAAIWQAQAPDNHPLGLLYAGGDLARDELNKAPDFEGTFGLVAELDNTVVGEVAMTRHMNRMRHVGEINRLVVAPSSQRQGIGSALLDALIDLSENWLNLSRLQDLVTVDNAPALTLYRKRGFVIEGKLRDAFFRNGRYVDGYMVARVRDAF